MTTVTEKKYFKNNKEHRLDNVLNKDNNNINLIRLICAFMVIYGHIPVFVASSIHPDIFSFMFPFTYCGNIAVLTFFFLSGLLVGNSLFYKKDIFEYILSRLFRIYPAFIVMIILTCIICFYFSNADFFSYLKSTFIYTCKNLMMFYEDKLTGVTFHPNREMLSYSINGSIWTISLEVKMYIILLIAFIISNVIKKYNKQILSIILILGILSPYIHIFGKPIVPLVSELIFLIPCFCFGSLLALYKEKIICNWAIPILLFLLSLTTFSQILTAMFAIFSITTFFLVMSKNKYIKKLKLKHDISYGVYIYGWITAQIIKELFPHISYGYFIIISFTITTVLGILSALYIEEPAMKLKNILVKKIKDLKQ